MPELIIWQALYNGKICLCTTTYSTWQVQSTVHYKSRWKSRTALWIIYCLSNKTCALFFFSTNNDKYMVKPSLYYNDKERVVFDVEKKIENEHTVFYFTQQKNQKWFSKTKEWLLYLDAVIIEKIVCHIMSGIKTYSVSEGIYKLHYIPGFPPTHLWALDKNELALSIYFFPDHIIGFFFNFDQIKQFWKNLHLKFKEKLVSGQDTILMILKEKDGQSYHSMYFISSYFHFFDML